LKRILNILILLISTGFLFGQGSNQSDINIFQDEELTVDMTNPDNVEWLLNKVQQFKNLHSIELQGETNETTLKKVFSRLSALKSVTSITLSDNNLQKLPDNIQNIKTLNTLVIEGNNTLDYADAFTKIAEMDIKNLSLVDNDLKNDVKGISKIKSIVNLKISGSNQLNFEKVIEDLTKLPALTTLSIPINFIVDLPQNIFELKALKSLDVSNNVLSKLPEGVSSLKAINNLSINGNIIVSQVKELEKFKGADIRYLSIDKEISPNELDQIKQLFPQAQINYPLMDENPVRSEVTAPPYQQPEPALKTGELVVKKDFSILSSAYINYADLFRLIKYTFDTLSFNERYSDTNYVSTIKRTKKNSSLNSIKLHKSKYTKNEIAFEIGSPSDRIVNYRELNAFNDMCWIYNGELTKKQFRDKYLKNKSWNDLRISFDKNNSQFSIELKGSNGFEKINASPTTRLSTHEKSQESYSRRFSNYEKALIRRSNQFEKKLDRDKKRYENDFNALKKKAWDELLMQMSADERLMPEKEWLDYYNNVMSNEKEALNNSPLVLDYLQRGLTIRKFNSTILINNTKSGQSVTYGNMYSVFADFMANEGGGKLGISKIVTIDKAGKRFYVSDGASGSDSSPVQFWPNADNIIIVQLKNGNFGIVSTAELASKNITDKTRLIELKTQLMDKNLDTLADLFKAIGME